YYLLSLYYRFLPSYLLPAYEEVVNRPVTPPPPYSTVHQQPVPSPDPEATRSPSQIHPALAESEGGSDYPVSVEGEELRGDTMDEKVQERPPTPPERRNLDMKELERSSTPPPPGRHRRFTGDSGIEVCVCNREGSKDEALDGLTDGGLEFCDSCCLCEQFPPEEGVSSPPEQQQHQHQHSHSTDPGHETPVSLLLGTIQENELQQTRHSDLYN
uniref:Outcome predictor in acute leukemia 1-like protein n=1 Tax=Callorhinchus milii TaxID=7868 RepID=A0A4W3JIH3_CALMI